jgi:hypothetical protein
MVEPSKAQSWLAWRVRGSKTHECPLKGAEHEMVSSGQQWGIVVVTTSGDSEIDEGHQVV